MDAPVKPGHDEDSAMILDSSLHDVLDFWFGAKDSADYGKYREIWFRAATPAFDQEIRDKFLATHEAAARGELDDAMETADGSLALLVLLDQFPRNMFRGSARAFATDAKARAVAKHAIAKGFDQQVPTGMRGFFYLPFEHAEDLADQEDGVRLFEKLGEGEGLRYAVEHRDVIKRFGRFPHRNAVLGRASTPEEIEYLKSAESWGQGASK
jgi:uncharacterized protein (DUF924 family)